LSGPKPLIRRNLIVSLWKVPDAETKDLMVEFYRRLATGKSKALALLESKRAMAKRHPNPFYWAAFVLIGTGK
jgi:CHAT domain-containing protein